MNFIKRWLKPESKLNLPEFTRDLCELEKSARVILFDPMPIKASSLGFAFTHERTGLWEHWDTDDRRYPLTLSIKGQPKHRVRGILHVITHEEILRLDIERQNGVSFNRCTIPVELPTPDDSRPNIVEAWTYKAEPHRWKDEILFNQDYYKHDRGCPFKRGHIIWDGRHHRPLSYYVYTDSILKPKHHSGLKIKDEPKPVESS